MTGNQLLKVAPRLPACLSIMLLLSLPLLLLLGGCSWFNDEDEVPPDEGERALYEAAQKNLQKDPAAKEWLLGYADVLAASNAPPSWPQSRGSADSEVALPSKKDAPQPSCAFATPQQIEQECRAFTERIGVKFGNFVHPVRAALTGTDKGPGLFDVVFLLGKDACVKRLRAAAQS